MNLLKTSIQNIESGTGPIAESVWKTNGGVYAPSRFGVCLFVAVVVFKTIFSQNNLQIITFFLFQIIFKKVKMFVYCFIDNRFMIFDQRLQHFHSFYCKILHVHENVF